MAMLVRHFTLFDFRLENERPLDSIAFTLIQTGNNLDHTACRSTCLHRARHEFILMLHNKDHLFTIQVLQGLLGNRQDRWCVGRQRQFNGSEHFRLQPAPRVGHLDPCLDRSGRLIHQISNIGDASFQFRVGESADGYDCRLPLMHLGQVFFVNINLHPDRGKIGHGVETFGGIGELTHNGVLFGNDATYG